MKCCYSIDMLLLQLGHTPLHKASANGHIEVVKSLINNQADISATDSVSDYSTARFKLDIYTRVSLYLLADFHKRLVSKQSIQ